MEGLILEAPSWSACGAAASTVVLIALFYYYLVLPMDWSRDVDDVSGTGPNGESRSRSRERMMRDAVRRKRFGNVPPVYPNGWFGVIESCRLKRGQVKYVSVLGQNLAVFRGESGVAHVLDAYCPHVGANMAEGGRVKGDCLECPFHLWSFDGEDGRCTHIPYTTKVPEFARVRHWQTLETNGLVFIWHHAEGEEPDWRPEPIPQIVSGAWSYVGRNEFVVSCHIQEVPENAADPAHLDAVHAPGMGVGWLSTHVWDARWSTGDIAKHVATLRLGHHIQLFGKLRLLNIDVRANQIGPGYVELYVSTPFGPIVIVQSLTPLEPLLQRVVHRMYCPFWLVPFARFVMFGESVMFERDVFVWNHKKYEDKPMLLKEEQSIARFRRWYSQFYSKNSPRHIFRKDTIEW